MSNSIKQKTVKALGTKPLLKPTTSAQWAYVILNIIGITAANHPTSMRNLVAQINFENGSTKVHDNNPLNTINGIHQGAPSAYARSGTYIPGYSTWKTGVIQAAKQLTDSNNTQVYHALATNASITDYAKALGTGAWEGTKPSARQTNIDYGNKVLARYNSILKGGQGGPNQLSLNTLALTGGVASTAVLTPGGDAIALGGAGVGAAKKAVGIDTGIFGDITSGFGIGWKSVGSIVIGAIFIILGIVFIFHTQAKAIVNNVTTSASKVTSLAASAA